MGWIKSKKKEDSNIPELPELPELPPLPEIGQKQNFPKTQELDEKKFQEIHQLPSIPNNSFGNKFSQNTIKEAISGGDRGEREEIADDFEEENFMEMPKEIQKMPKPLNKSIKQFEEEPRTQIDFKKEPGPVFIRLDKFEESQELFDQTREQISEIEKLLKNVKEIKTKEEETLQMWERDLQKIKDKIEKVNQDLFSKI